MDKEMISAIIGCVGGVCGGIGFILFIHYLFSIAEQEAVHRAFKFDDEEGEDEIV